MTKFDQLIKKLVLADIEFILIGGLSAVAHGSAYETHDLDICYQRSDHNIKKIVGLLKSIKATLRGVPAGLPFQLDEKAISMGMNFTFSTSL